MGGYEWIIWAGLIVLLVIVEMATGEFTFLMLALGAAAGLIAELAGAPWYWDILIAAVVACAGLFLLRPPLLRRLRRSSDPAKSNLEAIVGSAGQVLFEASAIGGQVKLANGETWTAHLAAGTSARLAPGTVVRVVAVDGASVVIEAAGSVANQT